jgi:hypothetical protein
VIIPTIFQNNPAVFFLSEEPWKSPRIGGLCWTS